MVSIDGCRLYNIYTHEQVSVLLIKMNDRSKKQHNPCSSRSQIMLFAMLSTRFDRELLLRFVPYYKKLGIDPRDMYIVLHSDGGVQEDYNAALEALSHYQINYRFFSRDISLYKFNVLV